MRMLTVALHFGHFLLTEVVLVFSGRKFRPLDDLKLGLRLKNGPSFLVEKIADLLSEFGDFVSHHFG